MPGLVVFMHRGEVLLFAVLMLVGITSGVALLEPTVLDVGDALQNALEPVTDRLDSVINNMLVKEDVDLYSGHIVTRLSSIITHQVFETAAKGDLENLVTSAMKDMHVRLHVKLDRLISQSNTSNNNGVCSHAAFQPPNVEKKPLFVQDFAPLKQSYEAGTKELQQLMTAVNTSIAGAMDALHKTNAKQNQELHETNAKQHEDVMEKFNLTTVYLELADIKSHVKDKHENLEKIIATKDIAIQLRDREITTLRVQIAELEGRVKWLATQQNKAQTDSSDSTDPADAPSAGAIQDATQWIGAFISPFATQVKNLYSQSSNQTAPEEKPPVVTCRKTPLPYELIVGFVTVFMVCVFNTSQCGKDKEDEQDDITVSRRQILWAWKNHSHIAVAKKKIHREWCDMPIHQKCFYRWTLYSERKLRDHDEWGLEVDEIPELPTDIQQEQLRCAQRISLSLAALEELVQHVYKRTTAVQDTFAAYLNRRDEGFVNMRMHIDVLRRLYRTMQIWNGQRPMPESMQWANMLMTVGEKTMKAVQGVLRKFMRKRRWVLTLIETGQKKYGWTMTPIRQHKLRRCIYTLIGNGLLNKDGEYVQEEMTKVMTGLKTYWLKRYLLVKARRAWTRFFSTAYWSGSLSISDDQVQAALKQAEAFQALADSSSGSEDDGVVALTGQLQAFDVSSNEGAGVQ